MQEDTNEQLKNSSANCSEEQLKMKAEEAKTQPVENDSHNFEEESRDCSPLKANTELSEAASENDKHALDHIDSIDETEKIGQAASSFQVESTQIQNKFEETKRYQYELEDQIQQVSMELVNVKELKRELEKLEKKLSSKNMHLKELLNERLKEYEHEVHKVSIVKGKCLALIKEREFVESLLERVLSCLRNNKELERESRSERKPILGKRKKFPRECEAIEFVNEEECYLYLESIAQSPRKQFASSPEL